MNLNLKVGDCYSYYRYKYNFIQITKITKCFITFKVIDSHRTHDFDKREVNFEWIHAQNVKCKIDSKEYYFWIGNAKLIGYMPSVRKWAKATQEKWISNSIAHRGIWDEKQENYHNDRVKYHKAGRYIGSIVETPPDNPQYWIDDFK